MQRNEWLSDAAVAQLLKGVAGMTPGVYGWGVHRARWRWQAVWWIATSIFKRPSVDMFLVYADHPQEGRTFIAVTGNGPRAEANAAALCTLVRAAPYLLAEIQARRHPISAVTVPKHPPEARGHA